MYIYYDKLCMYELLILFVIIFKNIKYLEMKRYNKVIEINIIYYLKFVLIKV